MEWVVPLALKSFLIAGGALLLLKLLRNRSAADRSWIAHLALAGLLLLPVATFALPTLDVAGPEFLVGKAEVQAPSPLALPQATTTQQPQISAAPVAVESGGIATINWPFWSYTLPAAVLLLLTLIALARLFILKARAKVLIDAPWLTALAKAQSRMGFKHGTALLTSTELPSPISWGVVRPVILLNADAAQSHGEAEAIITHELAHVAHLDWAKLLLARVATAIFWFNPFVWLLAREAHQLREEAADDAVLATDIDETEYARLLVGVARHECRGLLIGAHGVAPAKNSLSRRVKRVLDAAAKRAPGGWRWGSAVAFFAAGMAVPVAALNLVPASAAVQDNGAYYPADSADADADAKTHALAHIIANATGTAVSAAVEGATAGAFAATSADGATITSNNGMTVIRGANGATVKVYPADKKGHRKVVLEGPDGSLTTYSDARFVPGIAGVPVPPPTPHTPRPPKSEIDTAIEMKAVGVTAEYAAAIRAALPGHRLTANQLVELKATGVTPDYARELAGSGYRNLDVDTITEFRALGITGSYIRDLARAGYGRLTVDQLASFRALGVTPSYIRSLASAGYSRLAPDQIEEMKALNINSSYIQRLRELGYNLPVEKIVEMKAVGVEPDDLRRRDGG